MTVRLNQDYVENSFGIIRDAGGFNMRPNEVQSMARVKKIIVGKRFNTSLAVSTRSDEKQAFISSGALKSLMSVQNQVKFSLQDVPLSESIQEHITDIAIEVEIQDLSFQELSLYEKCEEGG